MSVRLKDVLLLGVVLYAAMHTVLTWRSDNSKSAEIPWQLSSMATSVDKLSELAERPPSDNDLQSTAELPYSIQMQGALRNERNEMPENELQNQANGYQADANIHDGKATNEHADVAEQWRVVARSSESPNRHERRASETPSSRNQYTPTPESDQWDARQPQPPTSVSQDGSPTSQSHQAEIRSQVLLENRQLDWDQNQNRQHQSTEAAYRDEPIDMASLHPTAPNDAAFDIASLDISLGFQQPDHDVKINDLPVVRHQTEQSRSVLDLNSTNDRMIGSTEPVESKHGGNRAIAATQNSGDARRVRKANWEEIDSVRTHVKPEMSFATFPTLQRLKSLPAAESQALGMIEEGKALATRGAHFAAKIEFINALELVAQSNDRYSNSQAYTDSLAKGLTALKESGDFIPRAQTNVDQARNVQLILESHSTRIIDPATSQIPSPQQAIVAYSEFAKPRLTQAVGESMAGSSALYHLSRLLSTAPEVFGESTNALVNVQKVLLLSSMDAFPANFDSANEMGVICFANGQFEQSIHWFKQAIKISGGKQLFWQNLAEAHRRAANLTQNTDEQNTHRHLAHLAIQESHAAPALRKTGPASAGWVSPEQFQQNAGVQAPTAQSQGSIATDFPSERSSERQPRLVDKIKDWF